MLHLENFFEKSFALLLTTPIRSHWTMNSMTSGRMHGIMILLSKNEYFKE